MNVTAELAFNHAWEHITYLHDLGILTDDDLSILADEITGLTGARLGVLKVANRPTTCRESRAKPWLHSSSPRGVSRTLQ